MPFGAPVPADISVAIGVNIPSANFLNGPSARPGGVPIVLGGPISTFLCRQLGLMCLDFVVLSFLAFGAGGGRVAGKVITRELMVAEMYNFLIRALSLPLHILCF